MCMDKVITTLLLGNRFTYFLAGLRALELKLKCLSHSRFLFGDLEI